MKPKQQTKQQIIEQVMEQVKLRDTRIKLLETTVDNYWKDKCRLRNENFALRSRLPHWVAASFILFSFAIGLYTGHKITQGSVIEQRKAAQDFGYQIGHDKGAREAFKDGFEMGQSAGNLIIPKEADNAVIVIKTKTVYRQIHHTKGAERLRLQL